MNETRPLYTIHTTADGTPQEELWQPADTDDAHRGGFATHYGVTLCAVGADDETAVHLIALGHDVTARRMIAAGSCWMRHSEGWANLLDDTSPHADAYLEQHTHTYAVLLRATVAVGEWEGDWRMVEVSAEAPGAIPITSLDLAPALDCVPRMQDQVLHLKARLARLTSADRARTATGRPKVVVLCGSTRFMEEMTEANRRLTAAGAVVLAPGCDMKTTHPLWADPEQAEALKARLDRLHRHKIELADEVVIVSDATGYYGDSTWAEITHAHRHGKRVRCLAIDLPQPHQG
jgi:hypothetical protein